MVPTFVRVVSTLKELIEDKIKEDSNINLTPYISKATLDVIGSVGKKNMNFVEVAAIMTTSAFLHMIFSWLWHYAITYIIFQPCRNHNILIVPIFKNV